MPRAIGTATAEKKTQPVATFPVDLEGLRRLYGEIQKERAKLTSKLAAKVYAFDGGSLTALLKECAQVDDDKAAIGRALTTLDAVETRVKRDVASLEAAQTTEEHRQRQGELEQKRKRLRQEVAEATSLMERANVLAVLARFENEHRGVL